MRVAIGHSSAGAPFVRVWAAQGVSMVGDQVTALALPLIAVLVLHSGAAAVGLLSASRIVPFLVGSLLIGVYVDRMRRRPLLITADMVRGGLLVVLVALAGAGWLSLAWLIALVIVVGGLTVLSDIATQSYLVDILAADRLVAANTRLQVTQAVARIGGPAAAGLLIGAFGSVLALLVDALSFAISGLLIISIKLAERPRVRSRANAWMGIREGLALTYRQPVLRALAVTAGYSNIVEQGLMVLLTVRFVGEQGHSAAQLGVALAIGAAGTVLGGLAINRLSRRWPAGRLLLCGEIVAALGLAGTAVVTAQTQPLTVALVVALCVFGVGEGVGNVLYAAIRQQIVPAQLQGRAYGSYRFVVSGTTPIGPLLAGAAASVLGTGAALLVLAATAVGIPVWLFAAQVRRFGSADAPIPDRSDS
ncbi:MFS transporter [Actinoplanes sp. NPDC026623]|uniref:MFS transporter n=1 Tax=Actinoplanes sp. NPDC026623 TaxID=3155610 RepID=UPI0033E37233